MSNRTLAQLKEEIARQLEVAPDRVARLDATRSELIALVVHYDDALALTPPPPSAHKHIANLLKSGGTIEEYTNHEYYPHIVPDKQIKGIFRYVVRMNATLTIPRPPEEIPFKTEAEATLAAEKTNASGQYYARAFPMSASAPPSLKRKGTWVVEVYEPMQYMQHATALGAFTVGEVMQAWGALYNGTYRDCFRLRIAQEKGTANKKTGRDKRWAEIRDAFHRVKKEHPTAGKDWIQRRLAGEIPGIPALYPRKRGYNLRTIKAATKDL